MARQTQLMCVSLYESWLTKNEHEWMADGMQSNAPGLAAGTPHRAVTFSKWPNYTNNFIIIISCGCAM